MAGIGFELKKIFKEDSISSVIKGAGYSTVVTIGPTIIVIGTILFLYRFLDFFSLSYSSRELLSSTILYAFIFSVIITAPFNAVVSRYIADKIYFEQIDDILCSFYSGLSACMITGAVPAIPFLLHVYKVGKVGLFFTFFSYGLFIGLIITFYSTNYLVATKDYKIITIFYIIGMIITGAVAYGLYKLVHLLIIKAILYGLTIGFFTISFLEFAYIRRYFPKNNKNYKECFYYFLKFWKIFIANLLYMAGIYLHNFIFWSGKEQILVAESYYTAPAYDMASCLAVFSNISMIIIFTVMAETKFHDIYQKYNEAVIGGTYSVIKMQKNRMFRLLIQQLTYLVTTQAMISGVVFLLAVTFLPKLGFSGITIAIYPGLSAAFFAIFCMYCNIIFLYYFNDNTGALASAAVFFTAVLLGTLISKNLSAEFYGAGAFAGAVAGWTYSFFRIRYLEKHFDRHIFCNVNIVKQLKEKRPDSIVYQVKKEG